MANKKIESMMTKAKETITSNERVRSLLESVKGKLDEVTKDSEEKQSFIYQVQTIVRMIKSHFTGSYPAFSAQTMLMLVFGLIYFITPIDMIPDFIPALGFTDDITLVMFIFKSIRADVEHFLAWEDGDAEA